MEGYLNVHEKLNTIASMIKNITHTRTSFWGWRRVCAYILVTHSWLRSCSAVFTVWGLSIWWNRKIKKGKYQSLASSKTKRHFIFLSQEWEKTGVAVGVLRWAQLYQRCRRMAKLVFFWNRFPGENLRKEKGSWHLSNTYHVPGIFHISFLQRYSFYSGD